MIIFCLAALSRDTSGDRLSLAAGAGGGKQSLFGSRDIQQQGRSDSRMSGASGGLPDLELDHNIAVARDESGDRGVTRTTSLLVSGVDMDKPVLDPMAELDALAKREEVLKELEDKKNQIKEAKGEDFFFSLKSC